jgi:predicted permease
MWGHHADLTRDSDADQDSNGMKERLREARESGSYRDARGLTESILQDLRYTLRTLWRDAGFACFAILIIVLGTGASSTVFSVLDALLLKPLPFKDPSRLVWIANRTKIDGDLSGATLQVGRFLDFRQRNKSFADIAAYFAFYGVGDSKLTGNGEPERLSAVPVSRNFFPLLGVQPQLGRQFTAEECRWNGPHVVMLSHGLWERRFGADAHVVGKTIRLDDADTTVVGVLPASFDFVSIFAPGTHIDLFSPFPLTPETDGWGNTLAVVGRLKPGTRLGMAQAEADVLGPQISKENPRSNAIDPKLTFLPEHVSGRTRPALLVLACAVGVVMLIVCANLSNLLLARSATRQREVAIRMALGAGRKRLIRQLLTESLVLTSTGATFGMALTILATGAVAHLDAFNIPLLSTVRVNAVVLGFTVLTAVATGLVLGIAPAIQATLLSLSSSLSQRGSSEGKGYTWVRATLVVSEIAFTSVLLVVAGLLMRSLLRVQEVDPGFHPESAAAWRVDPDPQYKTQVRQNAYFDQVLHIVRAIPGVQAAGLTDVLPLGHNRAWGAGAKGQNYKDGEYPTAFVRVVSDGYLRAMGMTLKKGRDFSERDRMTGATPVMMINETLARRLWPGQDPIGKSIVGDCINDDRQVIGVVGDVRHVALEQSSGSEMYMPIRQCQDWGSVDLVVRSTLPLPVLSRRVDLALRPLIPTLPKASMRPLTRLVDRALSPRRFTVALLTGFAMFALLLVCLGIYGVVSYSVTRRTQEIGIRMAMGAQGARVQRQIVAGTLGLAAIGLALGAVVSAVASHALTGLLYGVTYGDPSTFLAATAVMLTVAALAGYVPALRASRIDPMVALRRE